MFRAVRQASSAFCSFKEKLGGGQGATLGKVTDERAVEEGGGEVALKRVEGSGGIQDRSQGLKHPFKDPCMARESHQVTSHDRETHEKPRVLTKDQPSSQLTRSAISCISESTSLLKNVKTNQTCL